MTNEEVIRSRLELQASINDLTAMSQKIQASLNDQIKEIRSARFTLVSETAQMMEALKEVRKFFLENQHQDEVARLRAFVTVCQDLRTLATDGSLDKIIDAVLRLAVKP